MSDENINLFAGILGGIILGIIGFMAIVPNIEREYMQDEAVKRGFGQYVIEEKEIVFKWNDAILEK